MFGSIKNETSLLDAFNMQEGACALEQQLEFQNLSLSQKIIRVVSDCIIKLVAYVLGVQIIDRNVEALGQRYDDYTNLPLQSADYCQNKEVILVLHINESIPTEPAHFKKLEKQSNYKVVFKELASIEEANAGMKKLKENGCAIKALWIRAHGTPTKITFSQNFGRPDTLDITEDEFEENPKYKISKSKCKRLT